MSKRTLSRDDAASRISAYVYGNILVLAALAAASPTQADSWEAIAIVLGTGFATYLAHVFSELIGHRVRHGGHPHPRDVLHELWVAGPIASSAVLPGVVLAVSWAGRLDAKWALLLAIAVIAVRLALLGTAMERASGRRSSLRAFIAGFALAAAAVALGAVKFLLTH